MKIIIHTEDVLPRVALELVSDVIKCGLVSETSNGKQYCFHTSFMKKTYEVSAKKSKGDTHTFYVYKGANYDNQT